MNGNKNFLAYVNTPMSKESIGVIYDANNIRYEKCVLYNDFVQSLLRLAFNTYLGDDVTDIKEQLTHFKWCWDKNIANFNLEGIIFDSKILYEYFFEYMFEIFYSCKDKNNLEYIDKISLNMWADIFNYTKLKSNSDLDTLVEIYKIFEKAHKSSGNY